MPATGFHFFKTVFLIPLCFFIAVTGSIAQEIQIEWDEESILDLNRQAADLIETRSFPEAKLLIDKALTVSKEANSYEGEAGAIYNLGSYYETRGIPDSTITHLEENLDRFIDSDSAIRMGNALGTAYITTGQYQQGLEVYLRMLELAEERGEERMMIGITLNLGNSYRSLGEIPEAIDRFLTVLEMAEQRQDTVIIALAMNNLASINTHQQNYDLSEEYLTRALALNTALGNIRNQITNHISLGVLYRESGDFEASFENFQNGLKLATDNGILLPKIQLLHNLGTLYLKFDIPDKALTYFEESFRLSRENNIRNGYFFNQARIGDTYEKMGEYSTALSYFKNALDSAEESGAIEHIQETLENLYNLTALTGDTALAFNYLKQYSTVNDSLAQTRREEALAQQEALLGFRLEQENRMALEIAYQNEQRNFLIAVMLTVLLMLMLAVTVWLYKRKNDINELLRKRTEELTRVNRLKDSLLSVLAHDLRTPLSNLKGVVFLIRKKALQGNDIHEVLNDIDTKLQHGIRTVTNYLQWAQSQWDGIEVNLAPLNVHEYVESVLHEFSALAKMKKITFVTHINKNSEVHADSHLLEVILRNLLSNAVKFTPQNGTGTLQSETFKNFIHISIKDNGMGIRPEKLDDLFKPLAYSEQGTEGEQGTGLGLTICKDFAEKLNGSITVQSIYGEGSTFTFQLVNASALQTSPH